MMMMSEQGYCCDSCFDLIARRSTDGARLWLDLCEIYHKSKAILACRYREGSTSIRVLEVLGFIVTTETTDKIYIKVMGKVTDETGTYFCGGRCHE